MKEDFNKNMKLHTTALLTFAMLFSCQLTDGQTFADKQRRHPRVQRAILETDTDLRSLFADKGITYPPLKLFIRVFKEEKILELWAAAKTEDVFKFVKNFAICQTSGNLGPKRREGDLQIPEGFYKIDRFNPNSNFYLSLGLNYPNPSDRILGDQQHPGSDIFIHGGCVTVGCVPITDDGIKALYWLAVQAKSNGQSSIPVHIFPTRLDNRALERLKDEPQITFWKNLQIGYNWFERNRQPPRISVDTDGAYQFAAPFPVTSAAK